jgi:hypothetical protein
MLFLFPCVTCKIEFLTFTQFTSTRFIGAISLTMQYFFAYAFSQQNSTKNLL